MRTTTPRLVLLLLAAAMTLLCATAAAQDDAPRKVAAPPGVQKLMDEARDAYNGERYKEAIRLYTSAAQVDPGARALKGTPYRNLARCHYWLGNYDSATFWYDVYLKNWPKADDAADIQAERENTNGRRADPDKPVKLDIIYDRNLRELTEIIRTRLKNNAEAWTTQGGGTASLYALAIKRGYTMPELSSWADTLTGQLFEELRVRWTTAPNSPLPIVGANAEPLETSRGRIKALSELIRDDQRDAYNAYNTLVLAWQQHLAGNHDQAAEGFESAARALPKLGYLPYARALAQLRAGDAPAAAETLKQATPKAPAPLRPYYQLLHAEALRTMDKHTEAASLYMQVLQAPPPPPKAKTIGPAAPPADTKKEAPKGAPPARIEQ